jgi:hypothetical protein
VPPRERGLNTQTDVVVVELCSNRLIFMGAPLDLHSSRHAQGFEVCSQLTIDGDESCLPRGGTMHHG